MYRAQSGYREARAVHERALAIRENALGPQHPDVAKTLEGYAALLERMGRPGRAADMSARAEAIRTNAARSTKGG